MRELLIVALGGAIGAMSRYKLSGFIAAQTFQGKFPFATFAVNVIGCILAGLLMGMAEKQRLVTAEMRLFLLTGVLGGFTTFSAFGVETTHLLRRGEYLIAALYILLSVLCGVFAVWITYALVPSKHA